MRMRDFALGEDLDIFWSGFRRDITRGYDAGGLGWFCAVSLFGRRVWGKKGCDMGVVM